jgi:SAM-dependent methyltransferase
MRDYYYNLRQQQEFNPTKWGIVVNSSYLIRRIISQAIKKNSPSLKGKLLDYGCGSRPYEHFFPEMEYIGVDIETSGYPTARKCPDFYFNGIDLPFPNEEFESVLASEVFEHVFDLPKCLNEINRVLKPGGRLLATCPFVWPLHEEPYDFARYTPYSLRTELEKAGFKILKLEQHGQPIEVLGEMFLQTMIPIWLTNIPKISTLLGMAINMTVSGTCRIFAKLNKNPSKLYLSNVILVEKITNTSRLDRYNNL